MNAYFDTSALVPLLIAEETSQMAYALWDSARRVASVRLIYPEAHAALAKAERIGRISPAELRTAITGLVMLDHQIDHVEVTSDLAHRAGTLSEAFALRGYDSVHLAAAELIDDAETVFVSADRELVAAAASLGMATATV